jgi:hypothetical protein
VIFSKCIENSKNFYHYYIDVADHEYLLEIKVWAIGSVGAITASRCFHRPQLRIRHGANTGAGDT